MGNKIASKDAVLGRGQTLASVTGGPTQAPREERGWGAGRALPSALVAVLLSVGSADLLPTDESLFFF